MEFLPTSFTWSGLLAENIQDNEFLFAAIAASLLVWARGLPATLWSWVQRLSLVSVSSCSEDAVVFSAMARWVTRLNIERFSTRTRIRETSDDDGSVVSSEFEWIAAPAQGGHWALWGCIPVKVTLTEDNSTSMATHKRLETLTVTMPRWPGLRRRLLKDIGSALDEHRGGIEVVMHQMYTRTTIRRGEVDPSGVVYRPGVWERADDAVQRFLANRDWYTARSLPWHMGIGLWGPPGTGKTTMLLALASKHGLPVHVFSCKYSRPNDVRCAANRGKPGLYVFEDVDLMLGLKVDEEVDEDDRLGIGVQELMQLMDGIATPEGAIFVLTSNNKEALPPALLRPGRIDQSIQVGLFGPDEVRRFVSHWYGQDCGPVALDGVVPSALRNACLSCETARAALVWLGLDML